MSEEPANSRLPERMPLSCLFGFHRWSTWSDAGWDLRYDKRRIEKTCLKCGFVVGRNV